MRLAAQELAFGYPGHLVGEEVALAVEPGEVLCLLGPNGSGKTTLFKTLLGLLPAYGGAVTLGEECLTSLSRRAIAQRLAYVPQAHVPPFPYLVRDVVLMGRTARLGPFEAPGRSDRVSAERALATLGIGDLAEVEYTRISGGQRQLVLIARALAQETPILVMDEPTASLDFGNQAVVLREVRQLAERGLGIVLSTHDPDHAFACATKVGLLHDGGMLALGPPEEVLTPLRLQQVYGVRIAVERLSSGQTVCAADLARP